MTETLQEPRMFEAAAPAPDRRRSAGARVDDPFRLRVLYIDDSVPHIDLGSGLPRANVIVNTMAQLGYAVTFYPVFEADGGADDPYRDLDRSIEILEPSEDDGMRRIVEDGPGRYDVLWVSRPHNIDMVCRVLADAGTTARAFARSRVIFDSEAVFAVRDFIAGTMANGFGTGAALMREIGRETRNFGQADHVVTVSEAEGRLLAACGIGNVSVLGLALRLRCGELPGFANRRGFLFIGSLAQEDQPNVDSLEWLLREAWPALRLRLPDAILTIVGEVTPSIRRRLSRPSVAVLGRIADTTALFDGARVCIAPTRYAAGIPHKVYEAVTRGVPLVLTPLLAEQVGWPEGTGYLTRDWRDPAAFAAALGLLHEDAPTWTRLQERGLAQVGADCEPSGYRATLRRLCEAPTFA